MTATELDQILTVLAKHGVRTFESPELKVSLDASPAGQVMPTSAPPKDDGAMPSDEEMRFWSAGGGLGETTGS